MTTLAPEAPQQTRAIPESSRFERIVLAGIARGRSARAIADDLSRDQGREVTYEDVHNAASRLRRRYGARNTAQLIRFVYEHGHLAGLPPEPRRQIRLTVRMQQVLQRAALGLTDGEMGRELNLTAKTVKVHMRRMFRELDATSRAHAVALDCQHRYSDQPVVTYARRGARP